MHIFFQRSLETQIFKCCPISLIKLISFELNLFLLDGLIYSLLLLLLLLFVLFFLFNLMSHDPLLKVVTP